ncbi:DEAD/DEAH box helicase [Salmonella enterica]|nr:DEAD/DEAH box helicase [Salmonella enterica]
MAVLLRDYQEDAIRGVRVAFRTSKAVILVLATGAGKTVIFSEITRLAKEKGSRVLILAHRDQLIKQCSRKLTEIGTTHGIIMAGVTPAYHEMVQVGSVQTVVRRLDKFIGSPDIIIIDECHLSAAQTYVTILEHFASAKLLGVTGSPCRLDGRALGREEGGLYDTMVQGITIAELIARGFLVRPRVFGPSKAVDLKGVTKDKNGEWNTKQLVERMDTQTITGDAIEHYQRICPGVPAVCWCINIQHATNVAAQFNAAGIKAAMLCGEHDSDYRDQVLGQLARGEIQVVTFVGLLIEGVDVPEITCVIILRPTMSLASYLQTVGRGLRPLPWKTCCYVLDHAGLFARHGLPDQSRVWPLTGKVAREVPKELDDISIKQCPECYAAFTRGDAKEAAGIKRAEQPDYAGKLCCPRCWADLVTKSVVIRTASGELREITAEEAERLNKEREQRDRMIEVRKARSYKDLLKIEAKRGYQKGWAWNRWQSIKPKTVAPELESRIDRMKSVMVLEFGVTAQMLEDFLGHPLAETKPDELDNMTTIYRHLKGGTPPHHYFKPNNGELPFL